MKKIIKSGGWCSDGAQWFFCDFYETKDITAEVLADKNITTGYKHYCKLFGNQELYRGSLVCCNKIYGLSYEGDV